MVSLTKVRPCAMSSCMLHATGGGLLRRLLLTLQQAVLHSDTARIRVLLLGALWRLKSLMLKSPTSGLAQLAALRTFAGASATNQHRTSRATKPQPPNRKQSTANFDGLYSIALQPDHQYPTLKQAVLPFGWPHSTTLCAAASKYDGKILLRSIPSHHSQWRAC